MTLENVAKFFCVWHRHVKFCMSYKNLFLHNIGIQILTLTVTYIVQGYMHIKFFLADEHNQCIIIRKENLKRWTRTLLCHCFFEYLRAVIAIPKILPSNIKWPSVTLEIHLF
jgi:hypothetical protein